MTPIRNAIVSAAIGAAALGLSTAGASAAIVCAGNDCWHTHEAYTYPPGARVIIHPDNWQWGPADHYVWHEHEGRGYWNGDSWIEF